MFTKFHQIILEKKNIIITLFTRYSLYSVAVIESLLLPKLIDNYNYSQFEYYKNLIFIFPNLLLGSYSGYVYFKYVNGVDYYKQLFQFGAIISLFLAIIASIYLKNNNLLLPFFLLNVYTLAEQKLKIERKFTSIFSFKPILSILSISIAVFSYYYTPFKYTYDLSLMLVFSAGFLIWIIIFRLKKDNFPIKYNINKITLLRYIMMIKIILTGILASFLFSIMIFFERYYVKQYYPELLPTYSLAFNFSQIIAVLLSAISYITSVELGEQINKINRNKLIKNFTKGFYIFLLCLGAFYALIYFIQPYYPKFKELQTITFIISYSKGFFFLIGTISHLAVYNNYNTKLFKFLLKISLINVIVIYIMIYYKFNLLVLLCTDSFFVVIYSLYILHIVFNKIDYKRIKIGYS